MHILKSLGVLSWIDTTPMAIAWRLASDLQELKKRPLLSDLCKEGDRMQRFERLKIRMETLYSERAVRYMEAPIVLRDNFSAADICARKLISLVDEYLHSQNDPKTALENP